MSLFSDLLGTTKNFFKLGLTGVRLKNSGGNLIVRNNGDSADAEITTSQLNNSGDGIVINSDAAGSGNDWLFNFQRNPVQTADLTLQVPPAKGTDGHVLRQKAGTASGVLELELAAAGTTSQCESVDTTSLAFGSSSPVTMFTLPAGAIVTKVQCVIDTAFDDSPTASVGVSGTASKYMSTGDLDLTAAAGTVFEVTPGLAAAADALIITYSAGSSSVGAARFLVYYSVPT
jgi:hypothetical protein